MTSLPILYSFRRCPYAMRARMALHVADVAVEHREVALRAKPPALLAASPKGTVPVLVLPNGTVIDESIAIMHWALDRHDPDNWRDQDAAADALIATNDGAFKYHLDRMKYADRYAGADPLAHRTAAIAILGEHERRLAANAHLAGVHPRLADIATFPFIRQFARADDAGWQASPLPHVRRWLERLIDTPRFAAIMQRRDLWVDPQQSGTP